MCTTVITIVNKTRKILRFCLRVFVHAADTLVSSWFCLLKIGGHYTQNAADFSF